MITFDEKQKQILSSACLQCKDPYFAPAETSLIHAGCCSYSPIFSLFEINKMITDGKTNDFFMKIYDHRSAEIFPYEIIIHANVDQLYYDQNVDHLSEIEKNDRRLQYSICQFFEPNKGCQLPTNFKNATCRSFICLTIEDQLDEGTKISLGKWNKSIKNEVTTFNHFHHKKLELLGINLQNDLDGLVNYFKNDIRKKGQGS